jgi:CubicO group peptidase (beta-lactamase class C family)
VKRLVIIGAWICMIGTGGPGAAAAAEMASASLEQLALRAFQSGLTPGMAVAVVRGGEVAWAAGFGDADREAGRKVTPETRFYIASTSKALTALAASIRAARGEIDLDAPLSRVFPGTAFPEGVSPESVRVRDLLTHTHGIDPEGPVSLRVAFTGAYTNDELLRLLRAHKRAGSGRTFQYSNLGYDLIGIVLAPEGRDGWKQVVEQEVLIPSGMLRTTAWRSRVPDHELAQPYEFGPNGFERIRLAKEDANMGPAGGHFSTASDLARLLIAELNGGRIEGRAAFPSACLAETQRLHTGNDLTVGFIHRFGWGLGWDLGTYEGDTLVHRFGSFPGYRSHVSFMPARDLGVVVLVNGGGIASPLADVVAAALYDRLLGRPETDQRLDRRLNELAAQTEERKGAIQADRAKRAARPQTLPHPLVDYVGVYENPSLGAVELRLEGDHLEAVMGVARSSVEAYDAAKNKLRVELLGRGSVMEARFSGGSGRASSLVLLDTVFERR